MLFELSQIFPATVIAALTLFIAREWLDSSRRRKASKRKISALKQLLADECERNKHVIEWLRESCTAIRESKERGREPIIRDLPGGRQRLAFVDKDGESSTVIPQMAEESLRAHHFEAAVLDGDLFRDMTEAIGSVEEIRHFMDGLFEHVSDDRQFLESWAGYVERHLDEVEAPLKSLYKRCGKGNSIVPRMRGLAAGRANV